MTPTITTIPLSEIHPDPKGPRLLMREDVLASLRQAFRSAGTYPPTVAPIHVRPASRGYTLVSGHHRTEAARAAGLTHATALVVQMGAQEAAWLAVESNSQGEHLALEHGAHLASMQEAYNTTPEQYARRVGRSEAWAQRCLDAYRTWDQLGRLDALRDVSAPVLAAVAHLQPHEQQGVLIAALEMPSKWAQAAVAREAAQAIDPVKAAQLVVAEQKAKVKRGRRDPDEEGFLHARPDLAGLAARSASDAHLHHELAMLSEARAQVLRDLLDAAGVEMPADFVERVQTKAREIAKEEKC